MNTLTLKRPWHKNTNYGGRHNHNPLYQSHQWRKQIVPEFKQGTTEWNGQRVPNTLCIEHFKQGSIVAMHTVDHIIAIEDGGHPTDLSNLQALCLSCHNRKSAREGNNRRRKQ